MTKFKKTAALLLAVAMLLSLSVFAANAQSADNQPYTYDAETGTFTITAFSQYGMTELSMGMFQGAEAMTREVLIEDEGITKIGEQAFLNCFRLEKVTIPATVTEISESAFYGCSDSLVIYGEKGSAAAKFADKYGYSFKEVSSGNKNTEGNIATGIEVTILGIGVVFLILIILCLVLKLFEKIFAGQSDTPKAPPAPVVALKESPKPAAESDDTELVAVIAAAIAASLNTSTYNLKIKSVKRLGSSWNQAARVQNFNNNF